MTMEFMYNIRVQCTLYIVYKVINESANPLYSFSNRLL